MTRPRASAGPLAAYARKRDFARTPEPPADAPGRPGARPRFVVQKHAATRLHYDFRLEIGGVLASWALTRAPSLDRRVRCLAIRTEDHPLAYAGFEGRIPEGEYGGGTVMLWDEGTFRVEGDEAQAALAAGKLHLHLAGARLTGEWALVRLPPKGKEARESWLFLKAGPQDAEAPPESLEARHRTSVLSGRTMEQIAAAKPAAPTARDNPALPPFRPFMLCGRSDRPPEGAGWLHEIKHDGYRAQAAVAAGSARLRLRSGTDATDRFPNVVAALAALDIRSALLDGELVVHDPQGRASFGLLQAALAAGDDRAVLFAAFDLLAEGGQDLSQRPLVARKEKLRNLLEGVGPPLLYSDHLHAPDQPGAGAAMFAQACALGLEGLVSKRADSPYRGARSADWLKVKCLRQGSFRVIGWLPSTAGRGIRSLLLARAGTEGLVYAGKVGTGFSTHELDALAERLAAIPRDHPATEVPPAVARGARWVEPVLAASIAFAETTADGRLRHPVWLGPAQPEEIESMPAAKAPAPSRKAAGNPPAVSNAGRVIFPAARLTKGDLAAHVAAMAPAILAHAGRRPLSLVRCPGGTARPCFFQKHWQEGFEGVRQTRADAEGRRWLYVDSPAGLVACVQMGSIEFHGWGSRIGALDRPDRLVLDLDPDEGLPFAATIEAALHVRDLLSGIGLRSDPMLSGGKGVHVVVPLDASRRWPAVKDFARRFAQALEQAHPDRYVSRARKSAREGRIFVDWMRNQKGATAVMPWTVRARPEAPVATPVGWSQLEALPASSAFTLADPAALADQAARMAGWGSAPQPLPDL